MHSPQVIRALVANLLGVRLPCEVKQERKALRDGLVPGFELAFQNVRLDGAICGSADPVRNVGGAQVRQLGVGKASAGRLPGLCCRKSVEILHSRQVGDGS